VAGTHGKTTVTYMAGHVLVAAGFDPTVLVGDGSSSRAGCSRRLVAEGDESDGSLALHRPQHGILTSVELDHPDPFANVDQVAGAFRDFRAGGPGVGGVCADYRRAVAMPAGGRRVPYGRPKAADYRCVDAAGGRFLVERRGARLAEVRLMVPGAHNRVNASGAVALAVELGIGPRGDAEARSSFRGAR